MPVGESQVEAVAHDGSSGGDEVLSWTGGGDVGLIGAGGGLGRCCFSFPPSLSLNEQVSESQRSGG